MRWAWLDELRRRPDRAVGRRCAARSGAPCWPATTRAPRRSPQRLGAHRSRAASISSCSAPACPRNEAHVRAAVPLAARLALPVVATHPVQFLERRRLRGARGARLHRRRRDAGQPAPRQALHARAVLQDRRRRWRRSSPTCRARSPTRSRSRKRCNLTLVLGKPQLPDFPTPIRPTACAMPMAEYFRDASHRRACEARLAHLYPDAAARERERPRYVERLEFEIKTILKMGFPGYFLIVADFINWAKTHGCPVGPGRGSGAGSLVAYALKITDLDPLDTSCCSSASSIPSACRCPTSTSTSARATATASSTTSRTSTAATPSARSPPSARWRPRRRCATSAACSAWATATSTRSPSCSWRRRARR